MRSRRKWKSDDVYKNVETRWLRRFAWYPVKLRDVGWVWLRPYWSYERRVWWWDGPEYRYEQYHSPLGKIALDKNWNS